MYHNDLERESLDFPKQENNQSVLNASFVKEMICIIHQMYRQGWDERNGGNVSYRIDEDDVRRCLDVDDVKRVLPFNFDASKLIGQYFILTGTGKYFRNVVKSPETVLGIIRIAKDWSIVKFWITCFKYDLVNTYCPNPIKINFIAFISILSNF